MPKFEDFLLSPHFRFSELTRTDRRDLQDENRRQGLAQRDKLAALAALLEPVRAGLGHPLVIHSAYRCLALNAAIGGATTSQHMLAEACDFSGPGEEDAPRLDELFQGVLRVLIEQSLSFGQLIKEEDERRGYAVGRWLHLSLGHPYRAAGRCGEVLTMKAEPGGKPVYTLVKRVPFNR